MSRERAFKLKLDISTEEHDRLQAAFFAANVQAVEKSRHLSVYLDTPDAFLHAHDQLWCFSRKDKIRDGRLKAGDWRLDREMDARSFVKKNKLFNQLGGVFTLRLDRESILHQAGQALIEICLERAAFRHGNQAVMTSEAHFTLQDGEAEALVQLVSEILPHAVPASVSLPHVERGYQLAGLISSFSSVAASETEGMAFGKATPAFEAFKLIVRTEINKALAEPPPTDAKSLRRNTLAARRVRHALQFFAPVAPSVADAEASSLAAWETALEKLCHLEAVLTIYLKPAAQRGRWEGVANLVTRVSESRARAFTALTQNWPDARVKNMFSSVLEKLEAPLPLSVVGNETLSVFISRELAKASDDVEMLGKAIKWKETSKPQADDALRLKQSATYLQDVIGFLEPLTKGKSAKRRIALHMALDGLQALLDREYHLHYAQTLIVEAAAHIGRLKQTKTQNTQTYAAGALAGFLEALKAEEPDKILREVLAAFSEVKPFWTKND